MSLRLLRTPRLAQSARACLLALSLGTASIAAHAGLFDDNEARQAILDLRTDVKQLRDSNAADMAKLNDQLQRSLLTLQNQIDQLKQDNANQTGRIEELERRLNTQNAAPASSAAPTNTNAGNPSAANNSADNTPNNTAGSGSDASNGTAPSTPGLIAVRLDGQNLQVSQEEKQQYEASLALFQSGNFAGAERSLSRLSAQYKDSAYSPWIYYWIGNSQYALKRYADAIRSFKRVIASAPSNPKAPESALSIANCQSEMGKTSEARQTLENLSKVYPNSEAAEIAREKLRKNRG